MKSQHQLLACLSVFSIVSIAVAACYQQGPILDCCSMTDYDPVGNCSPWSHSCPDELIGSNPNVNTVIQVSFGNEGKTGKLSQSLNCTYQPRKCKFIGCADAGNPVTEQCPDEILDPNSADCPTGIE